MKDETQKILGEFAFYSLNQKGVTYEAFAAFFQKFFYNPWTAQFRKAFADASTPEAKKWFCEIFSDDVRAEEVDYKKYAFEIMDSVDGECIKFFEQFSEQYISPRNIFRKEILPYLSDKAKAFYAPDTQAVEEEKPEPTTEVFYKVGDRFKHYNGIYKLSSLGNKMVALVKIETCGGHQIGNIYQQYNYDYSVKDPSHITYEEFHRLTSENPEFFTLIKE